MMKLICIGGPANGQKLAIREHETVLLYRPRQVWMGRIETSPPSRITLAPPTVYHRQRLHTEGKVFAYLAVQGLTPAEQIQMLLDGYKP